MKKCIDVRNPNYCIVDKHTGEMFEFKQPKSVDLDYFTMVFTSAIPDLLNLDGQQLKILMCCWGYARFIAYPGSGNTFNNCGDFKNYVRDCGLDVSNSSIDASISLLAKKEIICRKSRGTYMLNPRFFFKGKLSERRKASYNIQVESSKE